MRNRVFPASPRCRAWHLWSCFESRKELLNCTEHQDGLRPILERLRGSSLRRSAPARRSAFPPGAPLRSQAESGPDPTRVGFRPDPSFDSWAGAAPSPVSLGPCTATLAARLGLMPSPPLRPTPRTLATRSSPRLGPGPGPGPRPAPKSALRQAPVCSLRPGAAPHANPPPRAGTGAGFFFRYTAPAGPACGREGRL